MDMSKVELQMKKLVHGPKETEPEIKKPELQLNVEMVASENIRLKEKLEAVEQENSKLKQELYLTRKENTVLRMQMQYQQWDRLQDQELQDLHSGVLKQKIKRKVKQFGEKLFVANISLRIFVHRNLLITRHL